MRATYRGWKAAALLLAMAVMPAWAVDGTTNPNKDRPAISAEDEQRLRSLIDQAFGPDAEKNRARADAAFGTLVSDPVFVQLPQHSQAGVYALAGDAALERQAHAPARDYYLQAITRNSTDSDVWANLSWCEYKLGEHDAAGAHMAELARRWPEALDGLHDSFLHGLLKAIPPTAPVRLDLLQSLASSGWKQESVGADALWFGLALLRVQRGESDLARTAIERIDAPYELVQLRSDRRFDGLYDPQSPRFDVARVAKERVDRLAARSAAAPDDLERVFDLTYALQVVGDYGRIVERVDAALGGDPKQFDNPEYKVWLLNSKSSALDQLGRWDEGLATMRLASNLAEEGASNVSQKINLSEMYCYRGNSRQALAVLDDVGDMSAYGEMALQSVLHCARLLKGDRRGADRAIAYLEEHQSLSTALYLDALLRDGRMDAAAGALVAALASEKERATVLVMVQDYLPQKTLPAEQDRHDRWDALVQREDVRAAIERVGRRQRYGIHQP